MSPAPTLDAAALFCHGLASVPGMMRSDSGVFPGFVVGFNASGCVPCSRSLFYENCVLEERTPMWKVRVKAHAREDFACVSPRADLVVPLRT